MNKTLKVLTIFLISLFTSSAGYMGDLPKFGQVTTNVQITPESPKIIDKEPFIPMAPKAVPSFYAGTVINRGKYNQYLKDLDQLIPVLDDMKQIIETNNDSIQMFCAKANIIDLYVTSMKERYAYRTEKYYESFKQLVLLNKNLTETADYWRYTYKYNKLIRGSLKDKETDERIMNQKLTTALKSIDTTLEILKENTTDN